MKVIKYIFGLSIVVFNFLQAYGQSSSSNISLSNAIQKCVANSHQIQLSNAKIEEALAYKQSVKDHQLPDVKLSGTYLRVSNPDVNLKVKLGSSSSSESSSPKVDQAAYGMLSANVPLFLGFKIKYGIKSAEYLLEAVRMEGQADEEEVTMNTISAYINLYKSYETIKQIKVNLKQQQIRVYEFTNLMNNGLLANNDLLKAQLQQSNVALALLEAESNYATACVNLNLMMGQVDTMKLIPDAFTETTEQKPLILWIETAKQNRKELAHLNYQHKAAQEQLNASKSDYYPGIVVTGGYLAANIPNFLTISNALNIGLGLQYHMESLWKTKSKIAQSQAKINQITAMQGNLDDKIRLQINEAYQSYVLLSNKLKVYEESVKQATENYRICNNKYSNNVLTTSELLDADVAKLQAELQYAFAKIDVLAAYKKLQYRSGILVSNK